MELNNISINEMSESGVIKNPNVKVDYSVSYHATKQQSNTSILGKNKKSSKLFVGLVCICILLALCSLAGAIYSIVTLHMQLQVSLLISTYSINCINNVNLIKTLVQDETVIQSQVSQLTHDVENLQSNLHEIVIQIVKENITGSVLTGKHYYTANSFLQPL